MNGTRWVAALWWCETHPGNAVGRCPYSSGGGRAGSSRSDQSSTDETSSRYCAFVEGSQDQLRRALVAYHGPEIGVEALADAFAHAWQHWDRVSSMENPIGYVFRVADRIGVRRSMRATREWPGQFALQEPASPDETHTNTQLASLLSALPQRQRAAVLLVHGFGWSYKDAARIIGVPVTTLTNDVNRGSNHYVHIPLHIEQKCDEQFN